MLVSFFPEMVPWLSKKSEDQSGGLRTNLEVFGDEVSFQYFQKTWKSTFPMPCKTKPRQSSREPHRMVHAMPRTPPDLPNTILNCQKNGFCEKVDFSAFLQFFMFFGPIGPGFGTSWVMDPWIHFPRCSLPTPSYITQATHHTM